MKNYKKLVVFFFFILISLSSIGQYRDFECWLSGGIEKKFSKKISSTLKLASRFRNNASTLDNIFLDASVNYKLRKRFKVNVHYRYSQKYESLTIYDSRNRIYLGMNYKLKTSTPLSLTLNPGYQIQFVNYYTSEKGRLPSNSLRTEVVLDYELNNIIPFISSELFYTWNFQSSKVNRIRYSVGLEYKLDQRNEINFSYMIQKGMGSEIPSTNFILSINYRYALK